MFSLSIAAQSRHRHLRVEGAEGRRVAQQGCASEGVMGRAGVGASGMQPWPEPLLCRQMGCRLGKPSLPAVPNPNQRPQFVAWRPPSPRCNPSDPLHSLVHRVSVQHAGGGGIVQAHHTKSRVVAAIGWLGRRRRRRCAGVSRLGGGAAGCHGGRAVPPALILQAGRRHAAARRAQRHLSRPCRLAHGWCGQRGGWWRLQAAHSCQAASQGHARGRWILHVK